ncbi:MAG: cytochrome-c oxidase [Desulfuromonas sp.]|nr:MAG: cytochrome-c oxidase [Desulfuromonas sp.]
MEEHKHEPVPYRTFIKVWIALLALTVVTVVVSRIHFGAANIWIALGIASVKSSLVIFIFMHLRQESRLFKIGLLILLVILAIFIGLTFTDILYR